MFLLNSEIGLRVERLLRSKFLLTDNKQRPIVLGVDFSIGTDSERSVGRADGEIQKQILLERTALVNGVYVAIFTVGVNNTVAIDHRGVDAPLEADVLPLVAG